MLGFFVTALLLSIDSFIVSFSLGTSHRELRDKLRMAAAFGFCDGIASLIGLVIGLSLPADLAMVGYFGGPSMVASYAIVVFLRKGTTHDIDRSNAPGRSWIIYLLPIVMSFDNLSGSFPVGDYGYPFLVAMGIGVVSGLGSLLGFTLGTIISRVIRPLGETPRFRWSAGYVEGTVLLATAILMVIV